MTNNTHEIGSDLPPRAAEVEPPAAVLHAGGSTKTDMGVTGNTFRVSVVQLEGTEWA